MARRLTTQEFIEKSKKIHGDRYDYSLVDYVHSETKVNIKCYEHGMFEQTPSHHTHKTKPQGCPKCSGKVKTTEDIIKEFKSIHGNRYDYSSTEYKGSSFKVKIKCLEHGYFEQRYSDHVNGQDCPDCAYVNRRLNNTKNKIFRKFKGLIQPEDYKLIPLTKGKFAKVDNEDFERLKDINWCCTINNYSINRKFGLMHRFIMDTPQDMDTDHINHDTLDNRKSNLRICNTSDNLGNLSFRRGFTSIYKGVCWINERKKWKSSVAYNNTNYILGYFTSEIEAAKAYDKKARELFGEFALTNF